MRLAVISDIHSNLPALEAVVEDLKQVRPDAILVAGDFINRGAQPREVIALLRATGWPMLRGNHEDYVIAQCRDFEIGDPLANPVWRPARWTAHKIDKKADWIAALPLTTTLPAPDNSEILVAHGTPRVNNDGIFNRTTDQEIKEMFGDKPPSLFVCAHTHVALQRRVGITQIANVGSVGLPFNGDRRAQYGVMTWREDGWQVEMRAVAYDVKRALAAFEEGGFLAEGGPLARIIRREVETALPHLGPWVRRFNADVLAGKLTVEQAVDQYFVTEQEVV